MPGVSVVKLYFRDDIDPNGALTLTNSLALGTHADPAAEHAAAGRAAVRPDRYDAAGYPHRQQSGAGRGQGQGRGPHRRAQHARPGERGVVDPVVVGGKDRTILIYLDPKRLQAKKLSPLDVVEGAAGPAT